MSSKCTPRTIKLVHERKKKRRGRERREEGGGGEGKGPVECEDDFLMTESKGGRRSCGPELVRLPWRPASSCQGNVLMAHQSESMYSWYTTHNRHTHCTPLKSDILLAHHSKSMY